MKQIISAMLFLSILMSQGAQAKPVNSVRPAPPPIPVVHRVMPGNDAPPEKPQIQLPPAPTPPRVYSDKTGWMFVYVADYNSIAEYEMATDGALTPLNPPSIPTASDTPYSAVDPTGRFAYNMDIAHGNVVRYLTHSDGSLASDGSVTLHMDAYPQSISFDPTGRFAYVLDGKLYFRGPHGPDASYHIEDQNVSRIYQYQIASDGQLLALRPAFVETEGVGPRRLCFTRDGQYAYAIHSGGVTQYRAGRDGTLTALSQALVQGPSDPLSITLTPDGHFAYVLDYQQTQQIFRYAIGSEGLLSALPPLSLPFHGSRAEMGIEPTGHFAYLVPESPDFEALRGDPDFIYQYRIETDGGLTPLAPARVTTAGFSHVIGFDPLGRFAYVTSWEGVIAQYRITSEGALVALTPRVAALRDGTPRALTVVQRAAASPLPPAKPISDEARRSLPPSPDGSLDPNETFSAADPFRSDFVSSAYEMPLVFDPKGRFAYLAHGENGVVARFGVESDGTLTPLPPAAKQGSSYPGGLGLTPDGRFAYLTRGTESAVAQFSVGPDGVFIPLNPATFGVDGDAIITHPGSPYVYMLGGFGEVSLLRVQPNGALAPAAAVTNMMEHYQGPATPFAYGILPETQRQTFFRLSPTDRFAYATNAAGRIQQYRVEANGKLTALSPPTVATGHDPQGIALDPSERFAYVPNCLEDTISQYRIGKNGTLHPLPIPTVTAGPFPLSVTLSRSGHFAYVVTAGRHGVFYRDYATGKIRLRTVTMGKPGIQPFRVGPDGSLSPLLPASVPSGLSAALVLGPTGRFAYQAEYDHIVSFHIGTDGTLTPLAAAKDKANPGKLSP